MIKDFLDRLFLIKRLSAEEKIIYVYRYFSLAATSFFYIIGSSQSYLLHKLIVIGCLAFSSFILNFLYIKNQDDKIIIKFLVSIEVIGNIVILLPTGGLNSPYIWYSLNTILVTTYYLSIYYCWLNLLIYLSASSGMAYTLFNTQKMSFIQIIDKNSNLMLSFILVTFAAQQLLTLTKRLNRESRSLIEANERINGSMDLIMSLYQAVHSFINLRNENKLVSLITYYTKEITKTPVAFFCMNSNDDEFELEISDSASEDLRIALLNNIEEQWDSIKNSSIPVSLNIDEKKFTAVIVKSTQKFFGVLGIEVNNSPGVLYVENVNQLKFLSSLGSVVLERFELEEINENLIIAEEQNRIAREIHDSVCQRIFAISCMVHTLMQKVGKISNEELKKEFDFIRDSLNKTNKELRTTIYDLNWKSKQANPFQQDLESYIKDIARLSNVGISLNAAGNQDLMRYDLKKAVYRIISEGTGNAIRHGKCSHIKIDMNVQGDYVRLLIEDDGVGFDIKDKLSSKEAGLGIKNIHNLVYLFNGTIKIESQVGKGTSINISLPNNSMVNRGEGEVV